LLTRAANTWTLSTALLGNSFSVIVCRRGFYRTKPFRVPGICHLQSQDVAKAFCKSQSSVHCVMYATSEMLYPKNHEFQNGPVVKPSSHWSSIFRTHGRIDNLRQALMSTTSVADYVGGFGRGHHPYTKTSETGFEATRANTLCNQICIVLSV